MESSGLDRRLLFLGCALNLNQAPPPRTVDASCSATASRRPPLARPSSRAHGARRACGARATPIVPGTDRLAHGGTGHRPQAAELPRGARPRRGRRPSVMRAFRGWLPLVPPRCAKWAKSYKRISGMGRRGGPELPGKPRRTGLAGLSELVRADRRSAPMERRRPRFGGSRATRCGLD